jgi:GT2 family glycosyltransferase
MVEGMNTISVVIPTWNRADLLQSVLGNLAEQTRQPDEIVVVDNGSRDNSADIARAHGARVIRYEENRGFAVAVNEGISQSKGDWILILNNDVVLRRDWIERLTASVWRESSAFGVGKLLRPDGSDEIDGSWDLVSRAAYAWRCGYGKKDGSVWSSRRTIHFAPMTAALFSRKVFETIGLLETRFESYYEDVDFGVRCALAGISGTYEPAAVGTHMSKTTLGKSSYRVYFLSGRNQVLILAKYYSTRTLLRFAWPILVGQILALVAAAKQRNFWAALRGKLVAIRRWGAFRPNATSDWQRQVERTFSQSEREIRTLQREVGYDSYWRLYFSLVRST